MNIVTASFTCDPTVTDLSFVHYWRQLPQPTSPQQQQIKNPEITYTIWQRCEQEGRAESWHPRSKLYRTSVYGYSSHLIQYPESSISLSFYATPLTVGIQGLTLQILRLNTHQILSLTELWKSKRLDLNFAWGSSHFGKHVGGGGNDRQRLLRQGLSHLWASFLV